MRLSVSSIVIEVFDKLHNHPRIDKYCFNNLNAGVSRSWNIGINMAEGKICFYTKRRYPYSSIGSGAIGVLSL